MMAVALALFTLLPQEFVVRETCALVEHNSYFDENGRLVFDQFIAWDWDGRRYIVRDWRLIKSDWQLPQYSHSNSRYEAFWQDGDVTRLVSAPHYRRTWLQYDPELAAREETPKDQRRGLRK